MAEAKKIIRLADVGELEADLKKDLGEEDRGRGGQGRWLKQDRSTPLPSMSRWRPR